MLDAAGDGEMLRRPADGSHRENTVARSGADRAPSLALPIRVRAVILST